MSCVLGLPGVVIYNVSLGYFPASRRESVESLVADILTQVGALREQFELVDRVQFGNRMETRIDSEEEPARRAWLWAEFFEDDVYFVYYELQPNAWNAFRRTLNRSTDMASFSAGPRSHVAIRTTRCSLPGQVHG